MVAATRFVQQQPFVRRIITLVALFSLLVFPLATLFPVFARQSLDGDARTYGFLGTANGAGALLGALTLAFLGDHPHQRRQFFIGLIGFCLSTIAFAFSTNLLLSLGLLIIVGWCFITALATANTVVQHRAPDALRGGVMGIYTLAFLGLAPIGNLLIGAVAKQFSAPVACATGAGICLLCALFMARQPAAEPSAARQS
jgi:MFS family permease